MSRATSPSLSVAGGSLGDAARALLAQQKQQWPLLRENFRALDAVRTRELQVDGLHFRLQFNPARLVSTAAKVDSASVAARPCFLCEQNLPAEQQVLDAGDGWRVLANPFPILPAHFTLPSREHTPQRIAGSFEKLLELARAFGSDFTVFYNGPRCGASAPDHLHFQAGDLARLPLFAEIETLAAKFGHGVQNITIVNPPLRPFALIADSDPDRVAKAFARLTLAWSEIRPVSDEPMINVLAAHDGSVYRAIVLPRTRHRPSFYDADGDAKIMLSPACIDLAGLCVVPMQRDFERITADHLRQMLREVCADPEMMRALAARIDTR